MKHNGNAHTLDIPAYILHAKDERGRTFRQIENDLLEIFNVRKDHVTVQRWYEKHSRKPGELQQHETAVQQVATPETVAETPVLKTAENAILNAENAVSGVAPVLQSVSFWREWRDTFYPADLVFYGCVSIGCIGVAGALPVIGVAVAALWFCVAALFLHRTKMFARWGDIVTLALIEILVGVPAHIAWANEALWRNVTALPIEIQLSYGGQMWTGRGIETPFFLACYCAGVLVFFGGSAVAVSTLANQSQIKK